MTETIDYIGEIHPLITDFRALGDRHKARLAPYFTPDGDVAEEHLRAYDETRSDQNTEAAELLTVVMSRLLDLCGPPVPGKAHTLTFAGPERHDGEAPYMFVVNGDDLEDARRRLGSLPGFRQWWQEQCDTHDDPDTAPDVLFLSGPYDSHPGIPARGYYNDLRREQATLGEAESVVSAMAASIPALEG